VFTPEKMEQIDVVFSKKDLESVVDVVVKRGTLQLVDAAEIQSWAQHLSQAGTGEEPGEMRTRREQVEGLMKSLRIPFEITPGRKEPESWQDTDNRLRDIGQTLDSEQSALDEVTREMTRLVELRDKVGDLPRMGLPVGNRDSYSYLALETGSVADENLPILQDRLAPMIHVFYPVSRFGGRTTVIVIVLRRDRDRLQSALREAGFEHIDLADEQQKLTPEVFRGLDKRIDAVQEKKLAIRNRLLALARRENEFLQTTLYQIRYTVIKQQIMKYFRKTERTYLISGWLPARETDAMINEIRHATQNRCIIERHFPEDLESVREGRVDVPVQMKNPSLLKPFELLTGAYGIPAYRTLDPTPLLGISFMLMFGMMFGDVGHGLVLVLLGLIFILKSKSQTFKYAGLLLCYVGGSSMLFGFLFGSIFGFENLKWLPPLWLRPMESISELFRVTIYFGILMIFMSMAINMINAFRQKRFLNIIFDKAGLLGAVLYWSGIVMASRIVSSSPATRASLPVIIPLLLILALILLFLREPIVHLLQGKRKLYPEGLLTGFISGIIEILEIVLGFLANTVSFIRIAAFGLVHAGLAMAIFSLSDSIGGVGSVFVIIFGNVFIIMLEGLVVSIQSVRLEFYEFFSRFFQEGRVGYSPLKSELERPLQSVV